MMIALLALTAAAQSPLLERPNLETRLDAPSLSLQPLREQLTAVLHDVDAEGVQWARGRDYRARVAPDGFTFLPVIGPDAPHELPVHFALTGVTAGGVGLELTSTSPARSGSSVTLDHGSCREVYHLGLDAAEQTFEFDSLPTRGELRIDIAVTTELEARERNGELQFLHPTYGSVTYGEAFLVDHAGRRWPVERRQSHGSIQLVVAADALASAEFPVTVDPLVTPLMVTSPGDNLRPDIVWAGRGDRYWVTWREDTSSANSDCYATRFTSAGVQEAIISIDISSDRWDHPAVGYHYFSDRLLVAGRRELLGPSNFNDEVWIRLVDAGAGATIGAAMQIDLTRQGFVTDLDVGGCNADSAVDSHFCVAYPSADPSFNPELTVQVLDSNGFRVRREQQVLTDYIMDVEISASQGDSALSDDQWTVAWIERAGPLSSTTGRIWARRFRSSGAPVGPGPIPVDSSSDNEFLSVTSRLDATMGAGDRPSIIAYERGGDVFARVLLDGVAHAENAISTVMEDVDPGAPQLHPSIATDGRAFYLTYSELYWNPMFPYHDLYYASGHITTTPSGPLLALAERHSNVVYQSGSNFHSQVCTNWDGEAVTITDDAAVIGEFHSALGGGVIATGGTLDIPTSGNVPEVAVGRQFCDANPNSVGTTQFSLTTSSWVWVKGTQSVGAPHTVYCQDVPPNAFGYLMASTTEANINMPGSTIGRLCLLGSGRYVNALQSSGLTGTYETTVDPLNIPQPTGFVAAVPGQTWLFQYWHRDSLPSGGATSNFSNACRVTFEP